MKKFFILSIAFIIGFSSCQKENSEDNTDTNYHVSFKADGISKSFTEFTGAHFDTTSGFVTLTVLGSASQTNNSNYFGFYLNNDSGAALIVPGEYKDVFTNFTLLSTYNINAFPYEAGQSVAEEAADNNITIANHFKVNITSMNKETVKGTFSGDFYESLNIRGKKITITDGDFYVKVQ
jgi:hypothetical protein